MYLLLEVCIDRVKVNLKLLKLNSTHEKKKIMVSHTSSVISEKEREIILTYKRVSDCAIHVLL